MKLNLGCGRKKLEGFVNIDISDYCEPDMVMDLSKVPYPIGSNVVEHIIMKSVIEHLPIDPESFFMILKEIYRICKNEAIIDIECPFPNHRWQIVDFTHQRPIHAEGLQMLDKSYCTQLSNIGSAKTPLAEIYDIDFRIESYTYNLDKNAEDNIKAVLGEFKQELVSNYVTLFNNVAATQKFRLRVHKEQ